MIKGFENMWAGFLIFLDGVIRVLTLGNFAIMVGCTVKGDDGTTIKIGVINEE
jgi:hypothetical protein